MATAQEAYTALKPKISKITEADLLSPTMDTQTIIGEAQDLNTTIKRDRATLLKVKINPQVLNSYEDRIGAYIVAEAEYNAVAFTKSVALTKWREMDDEVSSRKFNLISILRFCFEEAGLKDELKELKRISQGRGRRDMTVDYMELHKLSEKYVELFDLVGEDGALHVTTTAETFEILRSLLGDINTAPTEVKEKFLLARQSYTYLQQGTNEIRRRGQFAFRNDEEKINDYKSDHYQAIGKA